MNPWAQRYVVVLKKGRRQIFKYPVSEQELENLTSPDLDPSLTFLRAFELPNKNQTQKP